MKRNLLDYFALILKGIAMGAADLVPGVSGGTIAFISGIYEELISSLNAINLSLIKTIKTEGLKYFWKKINGSFLVAILLGIAVSILSLSKLITWLLHEKPILVWAFFFGLVLASILFVTKKYKEYFFIKSIIINKKYHNSINDSKILLDGVRWTWSTP